MTVLYVIWISTLIGFLLGYFGKVSSYSKLKPDRFRELAEGGILGDVFYNKKKESYDSMFKLRQLNIFSRIKFILAYLIFFPIVSLINSLGVEYNWWYNHSTEDLMFYINFLFLIPASFYFMDCIAKIIFYVRENGFKD